MNQLLRATMALAIVTGCAQAASLDDASYGSARLLARTTVPTLRGLVGEAKAVRVTILDSTSGKAIAAADFTGSRLAQHLAGDVFTCSVDHLQVQDTSAPPRTYQARVETFLDAGAQTLIGAATSLTFPVTGALSPVAVELPELRLIASSLGSTSTLRPLRDPGVTIR